MKLKTGKITAEVVSFEPNADGGVIATAEPVTVGERLAVVADDGAVLREYAVADYLRCEVDGNRIELTNMPAPPPAPPPEPAKPTEQEQQRADIDFLAAMVGVTL